MVFPVPEKVGKPNQSYYDNHRDVSLYNDRSFFCIQAHQHLHIYRSLWVVVLVVLEWVSPLGQNIKIKMIVVYFFAFLHESQPT